jgi:bifunctional enzyme CysN/CysC
VDTLHRQKASTLDLNEIGRVEITATAPLFFDSYRVNIDTGSFIFIDPDTNRTVAAGMIRGEVRPTPAPEGLTGDEDAARPVSPGVTWEEWNISLAEREARNGHRAAVVWFTGLSGAGKSTLAKELERRLFERGVQTMSLDGDQLRHGLCGDLSFSPDDRSENIRRAGEAARLFFQQGCVVLCAFVSPYRRDRDRVRRLLPEGRFFEVHVHAPLDVLEERDPKGLYRRQREGEISGLTGVDAPFEAPDAPALAVDTSQRRADELVTEIEGLLRSRGILDP